MFTGLQVYLITCLRKHVYVATPKNAAPTQVPPKGASNQEVPPKGASGGTQVPAKGASNQECKHVNTFT